MYLPTFNKLKMERGGVIAKRYGTWAVPLALWGVWLMYPSLYNVVYTDIYPPPRGVLRRATEE